MIERGSVDVGKCLCVAAAEPFTIGATLVRLFRLSPCNGSWQPARDVHSIELFFWALFSTHNGGRRTWAKAGHKEANIKLKSSTEEILREEQQQEWAPEQIQVPQQTEGESCGYRMLLEYTTLTRYAIERI